MVENIIELTISITFVLAVAGIIFYKVKNAGRKSDASEEMEEIAGSPCRYDIRRAG